MSKFILLVQFVIFGCGFALAQTPTNPIPTPTPADPRIQQANEINRRSEALRNIEKHPVRIETNNQFFRKHIKPLYRKPTRAEEQLLAPDAELSSKYAAFLKQKNTGLTKLVIDRGCADNPKIVSGSINCAEYSMPGAGSAYSFREEMHRLVRLADLNFKKNTLQALATLTHGIMTNLGDVPVENVTLDSKGLAFITKLKPSKTMAEAGDLANKLSKGIRKDRRAYGSVLRAKENYTYVLRSIAYRGVFPQRVKDVIYNEFEFDKRRDIIVAFRVVRYIENESVTILWKILQNKKSPKMKG